MASHMIVPVPSSSSSSPELASFLLSDGIGAGFVRHRDIWWNNDEFLAMVWALIKAPRKDGTLMKLLYIRHTVIETELVVKHCRERLGCQAECGVFASDEVRAAALTFAQARRLFTSSEVLCENMVIMVDGTWLDTLDTEIGMGLMSQSINPASCVKIIGLYSEDWDDKAAEKSMPVLSPLFKEVGIRKLSVVFARASMTEADPAPAVVDKGGLVDAMAECSSQGKHVVFFLPSNILFGLLRRTEKMLETRQDVVLRSVSLKSNTSVTTFIDASLDVGKIFQSEGYLFSHPAKGVVRVRSVIMAVDPEAGFTTLPVKNLGLVVYSHVSRRQKDSDFRTETGVSVFPVEYRQLSLDGFKAQLALCRGTNAKRICLTRKDPEQKTAHPVDHNKEFAFELVRGWPGKSMGEIPLNLEKRDVRSLGRILSHMAVTSIIEPYQNGYTLSKTKGAEMLELLPVASDYKLSFELVSLLASVRYCVAHQRAMRLLIRLAVLASRLDDFLEGLTPVLDESDTISWDWMEEAWDHMAGPARSQMATGRLWFALGIWEKMRNDTQNFSIPLAEDPEVEPVEQPKADPGYHIENIGSFDHDYAIEIYRLVTDLELRIGLPLLAPSDEEWEQPLKIPELHDIQVQLISAFMSSLAVWDIETDKISLLSSGREIHLAQSSLVAHPCVAEAQGRQEQAYLVLPHRIREENDGKLLAESALCMGISLLRVTSEVLGEAASEWLKWP